MCLVACHGEELHCTGKVCKSMHARDKTNPRVAAKAPLSEGMQDREVTGELCEALGIPGLQGCSWDPAMDTQGTPCTHSSHRNGL